MNDDDELKKEIEEALAVDPSPQFVARIRGHLANEGRGRRSGPLSWMVPVIGVAAASLVAGIVLFHSREEMSPKVAEPVVNPPARIEAPPLQAETRAAVHLKPRKQAHNARRSSEMPEVLIDPRETAALRNLLERVQERKIAPGMLNELAQAAERAEAVEQITPMPIAAIEPIDISPLSSPVSVKEGGSL